ncbi:hypothetical protein BOX15_Mlig031205g1, partial [Macrostomum lignano]
SIRAASIDMHQADDSDSLKSTDWRMDKRRKEKERRRERHRAAVRLKVESGLDHVTKRDAKALLDAQLELALSQGQPTICLDLTYESKMSDKEVDKLAKQLNRLYGIHRSSQPNMVQLCLTNYQLESRLATVARQKYSMQAYRIALFPQSPVDSFPNKEIIYLSPDAEQCLYELSPSAVYVIGGFVDEARQPGASVSEAAQFGCKAVRLPIDSHVTSSTITSASLRKLPLPVNIVFGVLVDLVNGSTWTEALMGRLPPRLKLQPKQGNYLANS